MKEIIVFPYKKKNNLKSRIFIHFKIGFLFLVFLFSCAGKTRKLTILETTDLHGVVLPFDFTENEGLDASLANSASYIKEIRNRKESLVLLDNGDYLQGQPGIYYYNFIDTVSPHFQAEVMNYLKYDAAEIGNHDIETGHSVYDMIKRDYKFPLLAANAVDTLTGKPYFKPYSIIEKDGIKIAILGLVTPSIPEWLPPTLYSGMEFRNMVETAKYWMPIILKEKPDLVAGLFHSGWNKDEFESRKEAMLQEDGSAAVAYNVPGFDIIFNGHDHKLANEKFVTANGDTVLMLNGGSRGQNLAQAEITFSYKKGKKIKKIKGSIINVKQFKPDPDFMSKFEPQNKVIHEYVNKIIGNSTATLSSRESYFGPSAFIDLIQSVQLEITGADVSFTAPLSFDVKIPAGPVRVGDMFKLYRYENMLYTMNLTGEEIIKYLEYSYAGWLNTMKGPDDLILKFRLGKNGKPNLSNGKAWLMNQPYNFDSAAGIDYTVDVSKPEGERVTVTGFPDGRPFEKNKMYKVAVNSYRGSGGGGHLTEGAGLSAGELRSRLITSTEKDLRYYILKSIESKKTIKPQTFNNWKIVPESWVKKASAIEYKALFGNNNSN
jgi:2',3'-cyclic-nucleotide 2'-phosphodiesterase/3'-nucleotidase